MRATWNKFIWGKVVGAMVGLALLGPVGLILGLVFGQVFDNGLAALQNIPPQTAEVRAIFFKTTFQAMGNVAKADGVISEREIQVARDIMLHDFHLDKKQMLQAIEFFNQGKFRTFNLDGALQHFNNVCGRYENLRRFFLELLVKSAMADRELREAKLARLQYICRRVNIRVSELDYQLRSYGYIPYTNQYAGRQSRANTGYTYNTSSRPSHLDSELEAAYNLLGVKPTDNIRTIKTAYRRLISKYHPDKLVAKGLPPEMMEIAKEKTQKLTVAYDLIMRRRS